MFFNLFQITASMSQTTVRQIGATGAGLILLACLIFELRNVRTRRFFAVLWTVVVVAIAALAFALSHLEVAAL